MKNRKPLTDFRITLSTSFGIGIFNKRAEDFRDCFNRLTKKEQNKLISIERMSDNREVFKSDLFDEIIDG
jgi:hypothetical protein